MRTEMTLYNNELCPECRMVREKMAEFELDYYCINVSPIKSNRHNVYGLTGQYLVPVLVDGDRILRAGDNILEYLIEKYDKNSIKPLKY